ncbi:MAG: hypothetical protein FVQ80_12990 [Planctomycetes bacterium]|nr:hypothetical protein [Planctomycetota bacterium]
MKRIEIIANHSVEEDILEALKRRKAGKYYTKIPSVQGVGSSDPRFGDHVWPEENCVIIIYCGEEEAILIREAVSEVKGRFETEGIKLFEIGD